MTDTPEPVKQVRRRQRPGLSCLECRRRKVKCNQARPCDQCTKARRPDCSYGPRSNAAAVGASTLPWASGKPEIFGPSSVEALRDSPRSTVGESPSAQNRVNSGFEKSTLNSHPVPLQPRRSSIPTPATSPEERATVGSGVPSASSGLTNRSQPSQHNPTGERGSIFELQSSNATNFVKSKSNDGSKVPIVGEPSIRPSRGLFSKTRLFGPSHWMGFFDQFEKIYNLAHKDGKGPSGEYSAAEIQDLNDGLKKCKDLARYVKSQQADHQPLYGKLLEASLPSREVCDGLVQLYFNAFESVCRILHIPTFQRDYIQYWQSPETVNNKAFIYQLILVLSVGASISADAGATYQPSARQWIYAAQSWLSGPFEKSRLNIDGIQIQCLLLLARQVSAVESDLAWISTGSLMRTAMQMGLHHDPEYLTKMSPLNIELRRRLWATIMEMAVQSSLESGQPPLISFEDFNALPPLNINDSDIEESTQGPPRPKDRTLFTDTSLQLALYQSLRIRLEIVSVINNFRSEPSFDDILRLDGQLKDAWRECSRLMQNFSRYPSSADASISITAFHRNLMEWMIRSYLLIMHRLPAAQAGKDPKFYFSRKACLDAALGLTSPEADEQFTRLTTLGAGFIRSILVHSGSVLCLELLKQVEEDSSNMALLRNAAMREPLRRAVLDMATHAQRRVEVGENNIRGFMFYSMVIGQTEAIEVGTSQERGILEGARKSVGVAWGLLKAREQMSTPASGQFDSINNPLTRIPLQPTNGLADTTNGGVNLLDPGFALENMDVPESWLLTDWDLFGD